MSDKKLNFIAEDDVSDSGWVLIGGIQGALYYVESYLSELKDGEAHTFTIKRKDMTQEELDSAPII